jgi:FMN-dependent NADH-azoreductase
MKWRPADPSGRMGYRDLSNEDLSKRGLEMARALRALAREMMAADEQLRSRCDKQDELTKTEQAKNQLRQSCNDESLKAMQNFLVQYEEKYKAEVLILREEMLHRLPELRQKTAPPILASHPTNALGLGEVASSLEVLAKLVPKMPSKT